MSQPFQRLPDDVTVPVAELRAVIGLLEHLLEWLEQLPTAEQQASDLDSAIGRMVRWIWPLLRELDDEDDYDE